MQFTEQAQQHFAASLNDLCRKTAETYRLTRADLASILLGTAIGAAQGAEWDRTFFHRMADTYWRSVEKATKHARDLGKKMQER